LTKIDQELKATQLSHLSFDHNTQMRKSFFKTSFSVNLLAKSIYVENHPKNGNGNEFSWIDSVADMQNEKLRSEATLYSFVLKIFSFLKRIWDYFTPEIFS